MSSIKEIMDKKVVAVSRKITLPAVCKILIKNRLSGVPVIDEKKNLVGFISERDIIAAIGKGITLNSKAGEVMVKKVVSVKEGASAEEASQAFTANPYRYLPVTQKKKIIGIISRKDVIEKLLGQYY